MTIKEAIFKERTNETLDHFLIGVYSTGTLLSGIRYTFQFTEPTFTDNKLRIRAEELKSAHDFGERDNLHMSDLPSVLGYMVGKAAGISLLPLDLLWCAGAEAYDYRQRKKQQIQTIPITRGIGCDTPEDCHY